MSNSSDVRRREVRALSELGLTELGKATDGVHRTHRAVSDRIFGVVRRGIGPAVAPVKAAHDIIADGVYRTVSESTRAAGRVGGRFADLPMSSAPSSTTGGANLIAFVNGLIGDELDATRSPLTDDGMTIRVAGEPVDLSSDGLAEAFPQATGRVALYLHGLVETEHAWRFGQSASTPYEHVLSLRGVTNVFLRYNTGRHISTNGADLAELIDDLVRFWPVPVDELILIGHSMGGLVARSAVHHGYEAWQQWVPQVRTIVTLGTPHLGAPLEGLAHRASAALAAVPETEAFGRLLRRRSGGIRDLRAGSLVDQDWTGRDPDDLAAALATEVPLLPGIDHYFVSATVTRNPGNPLSRVIGDGLVLHQSAAGESSTRTIGFDPANGLHLGRAHHFTLLNDPRVADRLAHWVG
ncbi:MAG: alpha/beta hydrolase [Gordonia sp. (in: high G+C Gram-positive bacteria)]|uniref:esterase/lipase family protein n=1 Tax=Gordonia sp. (in: high G+C Gram-positive bacteria) TaxID=84139 RepID=UPI0039E236BC